MAYCRGEVYAYRCGQGKYEIHVGMSGVDSLHEDHAISGIEAFRAKLIELRDRGLNVPDRVFERIEREISEGQK